VSRDHGVPAEKLQALPDYEHATIFTEREIVVLQYADAMTATPVKVHDTIFNALKAIYNDQQIVELTSAIAWENYRARFNHALDIESEGFSEGAYCLLPGVRNPTTIQDQ
jgi:alkylhydroperoxidase family enzyme